MDMDETKRCRARLGPAVLLVMLLALPPSCALSPCLLLHLQTPAVMLPAAHVRRPGWVQSTSGSSCLVPIRIRAPRCCDAGPSGDGDIIEDASVLKRGKTGGYKKPKDNRDQLLC